MLDFDTPYYRCRHPLPTLFSVDVDCVLGMHGQIYMARFLCAHPEISEMIVCLNAEARKSR